MRTRWISLPLVALAACSDGAAPQGTHDAAADVPADAARDADTAAGLRDRRYCEVLAGDVQGGDVVLDVYNTIGLNDCPDAAWRALDAASLRASLGAAVVVLNGPRHWTIDAFEAGALQDAAVRDVGGIPMRVAGRIQVPLAVATAGNAPYRVQSVRRDTTVRFEAGARVYELVDDAGAVFVMQSYSLQREAQTLTSLEGLGARLTPPAGWRFRTRVLDAPLRVTAVGGVATVTTDDLQNTYQRTQLTP